MADLDFAGLNHQLLFQAESLLSSWLPGGKRKGKEFCAGSTSGESGESLKINLKTGRWADFATGQKGGDLISLYAEIRRCAQGAAFAELNSTLGGVVPRETKKVEKITETKEESEFAAPPEKESSPDIVKTFKNPASFWLYKDSEGKALFYVCRYDSVDGKKSFLPWSWSKVQKRWVQKGWPAPRPLFGLDLLSKNPGLPILIVEGEKACQAAQNLFLKRYVVITWPNGASAASKVDWSPLFGRKILIWPDADKPGRRVSREIGNLLSKQCSDMRMIDAPGESGSDAFDWIQENGCEWKKFVAWVKPRVKVYEAVEEKEEVSLEAPDSDHSSIKVDLEDLKSVTQFSHLQLWDQASLVVNLKGTPIMNFDNSERVLRNLEQFKDQIWFDEFHHKIFLSWRGKERVLNEADQHALLLFMQREAGLSQLRMSDCKMAIKNIAFSNLRNEAKDWLESLVWDGKPRLFSFFTEYMGADPTEYTAKSALNWWISMVARIYKPGCKVDNMVILEGGQGNQKSESLMSIAGDGWYLAASQNLESRDFLMSLRGKLIVEFPELDSFSKADANTIKKIVSNRLDTYRDPYGMDIEDHRRQCVFVGTTNDSHYLKDPTGARRFWPISTQGRIKLKEIEADRSELFAEAATLYKQGEEWWEMPRGLTEEIQETRRQVDAWEETILNYIENKHEVTLSRLAIDALRFEISKIDARSTARIANILRVNGWEALNQRRDGQGGRLRPWRRKRDKDAPLFN